MEAKYQRVALQNVAEFEQFCAILKRENVRRYLEIGGKHGGSLWRAAKVLPPGALVVSVDLPHGDLSFKDTLPNLQACVEHLSRDGYDAHLIIGDSTLPSVVESVRALGPFDACFIDANHTLPYVTKDWENYGPMCRIVAFHDIGWIPRENNSKKMPIEAPILWNEIKKQYRHQEIKLEPRDNGIGVLWRS